MSREKRSLKERFEEKFVKGKPDECWEWNAAIKNNGYGVIGVGRRTEGIETAHRLSYMFYVGAIPEGKEVCHTCDNRKCVNPKHLYVGTRVDNMQDCVKKNRTNKPKGEAHFRAILTEIDVLKIRASRKTNKHLANEYGMSVSAIRSARKGYTWKHI